MFNYNTSSLDTNVILRLIIKDSPAQAKKVLDLISDTDKIFIAEDIAIMEAAHTLETYYERSREEVVDSLESFFRIKNIFYASDISASVFAKAYPLYLKYPMLSFNDCYLAVKSEASAAEPLWTFDKLLAKKLPSAKEIAPSLY